MKKLKPLLLAFIILVVFAVLLFAVAVHRGFRATAKPPAIEVAIARGVRNFGIPGGERRLQNPLPANSDTYAEARQDYISHCSNCHGVDGSGKTQVGTNLYPRVPDLRAPATQSLTDGEIHYIIENGVQLTGMPAWGNSHAESSSASWKLVRFIRGFRQSALKEEFASKRAPLHAQYVGSQSCQKCHAEIYQRWKKTPMANIVRDPRQHPEAIIGGIAANKVAPFKVDQVAFVYGSLWKQRFFTKIGDDYFPLPVQWDVATKTWLPYKVPPNADWWAAYYPPDNMQRPTGPTCDGCHSVDYNLTTKQVAEWNVGCERCHGPGSEHVAKPTRDNILSPDELSSNASTDTCVQCHSQGQPLSKPIDGKYVDWPVGYRVDLNLNDFWKLEDCKLGETTFYYFPDCTAHKNRMQGNDFVQSVMYRHNITCATCHDVHGTTNYAQLRKPSGELCLDCHGPASANGPHTATLEDHTHHKAGSTGSECVACHMPAIETEGVPNTMVHAHTFRFISPSMTDKYNMPNPCTTCHQGKSTGWAQEAMRRWPDYSVERSSF